MRKSAYPRDIYRDTEKTIKKINTYEWKHRNLILLAASVIAAYYMFRSPAVTLFIEGLGDFGYPAAFMMGLFFSYGITTPPATAALFDLGTNLNPFIIAAIGAIGSVISDFIIFKFVKDRLVYEIRLLSREMENLTKPVSHLFFWEELRVRMWHGIKKSKIWHILVPILAGLIIASPLPDELGAALFGAVRFDTKKFLAIAYAMNFLGILLISYSGRVLG